MECYFVILKSIHCLQLPPPHEHACCFGIVVVEEKAFARVERGDGGHVFIGECEIEDIDILLHPLDVGRFRNDDYAALYEPTQGDLRHRFAVFMTDFGKNRIREEAVTSLCQRPPTT